MTHKIITAGEPLIRCQTSLGEGPVWDQRTQTLYFVDINKSDIHTYVPKTGEHSKQNYGGSRLGSIVLREDQPGFVCGAEKTLAFGTFDGKLDAIAEPVVATASNKQTVRFNDGVCDRKGRFITGTMVEGDDTESRGQLFSLDPETKEVTILLEDVLCSNGTGWSPDDKIMYYVDSPRGVIHKYDYDLETGKLSNKSVFATNTFGDGGSFDGLCMGVDGSVFVSRWKSNRLVKYLPSGEIDLEIRFPKAANITCCCFGGDDMSTLFVTTANSGPANGGTQEVADRFPEGGDLYSFHLEGERGGEKFRFRG